MAGHSRWAQVKHKKAGADAKRSALFSKLARTITAAAREHGPDPTANAQLRAAIEQARSSELPKENIERAINRASGAGSAEALVGRDYEAYGPGGSAFLIQVVTDNVNRTTSELKVVLADFEGKLAEAGSVAWIFERRAFVSFNIPPEERNAATLALIDAGAIDIDADANGLTAVVPPGSAEAFQRSAAERGHVPRGTAIALAPKTTTVLDPWQYEKARALKDALEDHPDVTAVSTNIQSPA